MTQKRILLLKEKEDKRYGDNSGVKSMSSQINETQEFQFDADYFQQRLPQQYKSVLNEFQKIAKQFFLFHTIFISTLLIECIALFPLGAAFSRSTFLALGLGVLFLTLFSYLILLFYQQAKKPEQIRLLLHRFIESCKSAIGLPEKMAQHHLNIADALLKLAAYLDVNEERSFFFPKFLYPFIARSTSFCYLKDVFYFKQLLMHAAIDEHLEQIRATPTDLEVHASLASAYVLLSQLYKAPKEADETPFHAMYHKNITLFEEQFERASKLAIEEFEILNQYAPNDPWIHEQLAMGYRNLGLYQKEIAEIELLLKLKAHDRELLFRLGSLYFEQNQNARGLEIYEQLKQSNFKRAEELISGYGKASILKMIQESGI